MSGVFMDGGGSESLGHGGDGIDHGGHDHGSHGVQHGHGQGGHSFLAQILGLDQQDHAHLAHHGGEGAEGQAPSQTPAWNSAMQGLKLENLLAGINITPNFLLLMLFSSFVAWLGVIYWIRHHEPFANQVLGSSAAFAPTVGADRRLINDCRDALPIKTSAQTGVVYSPQPGQNSSEPPSGSPVDQPLSNAMRGLQIGGAGPTPVQAAMQAPSQSYAPTQSYAPATAYQQTSQSSASPVNSALSAAMGAPSFAPPAQSNAVAGGSAVNSSLSAAMGATSFAPAAQGNAVTGGSAVNSSLSAAMASALGPAPAAAPASASMGAAQQSAYGQPAYTPAQAGYPMSQQMPMSSAQAPMSAAMPPAGGMRLFSSRRSLMAQSLGPAPSAAPAYGAPPQNPYGQGAPAQYGQPAQGQYGQPAPAPYAASYPAPPPAASANTWSLANQGSGFSADTAQFDSQFGAPLAPINSMPAGSYPVSTSEGTRLKVVTDK